MIMEIMKTPSLVLILLRILLSLITTLVEKRHYWGFHRPILFSAYVPYCSSDCYTGRKNASLVTDNLTFHGHYILEAVLDDLIKNTWLAEAEEVKKVAT